VPHKDAIGCRLLVAQLVLFGRRGAFKAVDADVVTEGDERVVFVLGAKAYSVDGRLKFVREARFEEAFGFRLGNCMAFDDFWAGMAIADRPNPYRVFIRLETAALLAF